MCQLHIAGFAFLLKRDSKGKIGVEAESEEPKDEETNTEATPSKAKGRQLPCDQQGSLIWTTGHLCTLKSLRKAEFFLYLWITKRCL